MKGNKNYFELAGSSYRGFELLRVRLQYKCVKEIQGKLTLVRVSTRFKLARVRVLGSQLYSRSSSSLQKLPYTLQLLWKCWLLKQKGGKKSYRNNEVINYRHKAGFHCSCILAFLLKSIKLIIQGSLHANQLL